PTSVHIEGRNGHPFELEPEVRGDRRLDRRTRAGAPRNGAGGVYVPGAIFAYDAQVGERDAVPADLETHGTGEPPVPDPIPGPHFPEPDVEPAIGAAELAVHPIIGEHGLGTPRLELDRPASRRVGHRSVRGVDRPAVHG